MADLDRVLHVSGTIADSLSPSRLHETLATLTRAAVASLPGVDEASISVLHSDGTMQSYAMTADFLEDLDRVQYADHEGPCYDGMVNNAFTVCGDLANDPRYPRYGAAASAKGIRSQAGIRIFESSKSKGALNVYSRSVGALADISFLAELFADQARTAITYAQEIDGLREAMLSRQRIGQAVGILMERYQLSEERSFAFLARLSQDRNVKLRLVAEEVIEATRD